MSSRLQSWYSATIQRDIIFCSLSKMSKTRGSAWENQKPCAVRFPHPSFKLCFLIRWFCKRKTQQWKITSWWDVRETSVTNMVQNFIDFSFHKMFFYTQAWWKSKAVQTEYVFLFNPQDSYKKLYFCQYRYTLSLCLYAFTVYVFETHQIISELCYLVVGGGYSRCWDCWRVGTFLFL